MSTPKETKQWILKNKPTDLPQLGGSNATFELQTNSIPALKDDQVLVKTLYISNDPAQRGWISKGVDPKRLYVPPVAEGAPMRAWALTQILESKASNSKLQKDKYCITTANWSEYAVVDASSCQPVEEVPGLNLTHYLGALGLNGLTAYVGLNVIAGAGPEDTVVVSGAAGATGSLVVQMAKKIVGCKKVIGFAGTDEKCRWVEKLGADKCLNYKKENFQKQLNEATDGFVEVFFDNVGGEILDMMLLRMKRHGRIAACGAIANYNKSEPTGLRNYFEVVSNRLEIKGFIVLDHKEKAEEITQLCVKSWKEGKLELGDESETVVETKFEDIPKTWMKLFDGGNTGKLITKLV